MTAVRVNVMLIQTADVTIEVNDTVCSQNVELCELSYDNDSDDMNKEYINLNLCDSLNILAALMKTCEKQKTNSKDKNKQVTQDHVKKKKQYLISRILHREKYLDTSQQVNQTQQSNATHDQVVKSSSTSSQTVVEDDAESSNDIMMTDKSVKHAPVSRKKKLMKEIKDHAKKSSEKLLALLMKQEIHDIMIQDILDFSLSIHKMMFQNLSSELQSDVDKDEVVQISSGSLDDIKKGLKINDL